MDKRGRVVPRPHTGHCNKNTYSNSNLYTPMHGINWSSMNGKPAYGIQMCVAQNVITSYSLARRAVVWK